jgi:hypothetical protein
VKTRFPRRVATARGPRRPLPAAIGTAGWANAEADRAQIRTALRAPPEWKAPETASVPAPTGHALDPVQPPAGVQAEAIARHGISGPRSSLPDLERVQASFGAGHDLSSISAHFGDRSDHANDRLGARAYTFGEHIAFRGSPTLHRAAHEAAHVVQQRGGALPRGLAPRDGVHERIANRVADRVQRGATATDLLPAPVRSAAPVRAIQRDPTPAPLTPEQQRNEAANDWLAHYDSLPAGPERAKILRRYLLLRRNNVKLDTQDDIDWLISDSLDSADSERETWLSLLDDFKSEDFLIEHGEAFPEIWADTVYKLAHIARDERSLWSVRDQKRQAALDLVATMGIEIWDRGLPVVGDHAL